MTILPQEGEGSIDKFEHVREVLWGQPGFQRRNTTITSPGSAFFPQATWIVETIKTQDATAIFLQVIDKDGGTRFVLPEKVCEAIYRQSYTIKGARRSAGAKAAAEKRKAAGIQPFGGKPFRKQK